MCLHAGGPLAPGDDFGLAEVGRRDARSRVTAPPPSVFSR